MRRNGNPSKKRLLVYPFADDQVVIAPDEDLSYMVRKLREESITAGLEANFKKI